MVTRAEVSKIISDHEIEVKVPKFGLIEEGEGEEEVNELPIARICTIPGILPDFKIGDIVLICIEDNDLSKTMIMGKFIPDEDEFGTAGANLSNLKVTETSDLPENTNIGDVNKDHIYCLLNVQSNIQQQFNNNISQKINLLQDLAGIFKDTVFE